MKSGVYYLYEYKNNQRSRNVGFLKFSCGHHTCSLQICARGISVFHKDLVSLCMLHSSADGILARTASSISCENHAISCKINIPLEDSETPSLFDTICGFLLKLPDNSYIAATEEGFSFSPEILIPHSPKPIPANPDDSTSGNSDSDDSASGDPAPDDSFSNGFTPDKNHTSNITPSSKQTLRKIQRSELSLLPRKYWNLANNSFLMHGYYNYNHLLLIEENGHILLGVPGIYDKREARAAGSFGFPIFSESYNTSLDLSSDEINPHGTFGYWCREIPLND